MPTASLRYIGRLYDIERHIKDMPTEQRQQFRQEFAKPLADALHEWMRAQRDLMLAHTTSAKALDYSLKRWAALTRLPAQPNSRIGELLPHNWVPGAA